MSEYFPNWGKERAKLQEIHDYRYLIKRFPDINETDINLPDEYDPRKKNRSFCTVCNSYFRNKRHNASQSVLQEHYKLLLSYKNDAIVPDFKTALQNLVDKTGVVNPKLASQALHFLNHDLPIYSAPILERLLNITVSPGLTENNMDRICEIYDNLKQTIVQFCDNEDTGQKIIKDFKDGLGEYITCGISNTKIIDFYFWLPTLDK